MQHLDRIAVTGAAILALTPFTAIADNGLYVGGSIGAASLTEDFDDFDIDADSTAFRIVAGWQFNDYFSLEGGYHRFGAFEQTFDIGGEAVDVAVKADGFTLGATGAIPLGERFALYGRAGSFFWDGDAEINSVSQARPEDTNLYIGAGAKFAISDRISLLGDWTRYELEDTESDVASFGLVVSF
ncbi:MAG: porin family protein [Pseudomonadota bacterium]